MFKDTTILFRSFIVVLILLLSWLIFSPNILPQKLAIVFNDTFRGRDQNRDGSAKELGRNTKTRQAFSQEFIQDFINDRENGLLFFFPNTECKPEADDNHPASHRCVIEDTFITAARINELFQAYPKLLNQYFTRLLPSPIETFFGGLKNKASKNLKIKLGLDLQGGMRAVFKADFESYLEHLKEKLGPYLKKLQSDLEKEKEALERTNIQSNIDSVERQLELGASQKLLLLKSSKEVIDKRLASQGLTEPEVRIQEESKSIAVDMPGVANSREVLERIKDTVTVEYRIVNDDATNRINAIPENQESLRQLQTLYRADNIDPEHVKEIFQDILDRSSLKAKEGRLFLYWRRPRNKVNSKSLPRELCVLGPPLLDGSEMDSASSNRDPTGSWYRIYFRLSERGATKFGDLTKENVGKKMAILWGDRVVSTPVLNEPIYGGNGQISGQFSEAEARDIANVIQEGALPIPLKLLSVSSVGPTLGRSSITIGVFSILIGYGIVLLFMIGYYRLSGIITVISLFCNLLIMMAIMSLLEFTFTLPGIAGIILTIGMAVDASVIIFEKIKEDLRLGKPARLAVDNGFKSSLWTIIDANITTLIAAVILWIPRDGPIMGFAIVLFFGLLSSMFTAIFLSRLIFDWIFIIFPIKNLSIGYGIKARNI